MLGLMKGLPIIPFICLYPRALSICLQVPPDGQHGDTGAPRRRVSGFMLRDSSSMPAPPPLPTHTQVCVRTRTCVFVFVDWIIN